jgi:hypothetical protein
VIFVAAHAVEVVIVNHPDHRPAVGRQGIEHAEIGKLVQDYEIGLEPRYRMVQRAVACGFIQPNTAGKDITPFGIAAVGASMRNGHKVTPLSQLLRRQKDVCLGAAQGAEPFMNE